MKPIKTLLAATLLAISVPAQTTAPAKKVYAFFSSWSVYARNYHIADVPADRITHLLYAFAKVENGRIGLADVYADTQKFYPGDSWATGALRGSFHQMQILKTKHPGLKTLISVGGAGASQGFSAAVSTITTRKAFATSIVDFVVKYGFDGVDLDWEFPGSGPNLQDPANFTLFVTELRTQLDARAKLLNTVFELTIDVPANPKSAAKLELGKLHPLVDAMLLTSLDYFVPIANLTNPISHLGSPLYPIPGDPTPAPYSTDFNVQATTQYYLGANVPNSKLILGMPLYGRGYAGISGGTNGLFSKYTGPMTLGTWGAGVFDYTDLANNYISKAGYTSYWNDAARAPRLYNPTTATMISYEDARSIREKCWFLQAHDLGGAMVWELSADRTATLLSEIDRVVLRQPRMSTTTHEISVTTPAKVALDLDSAQGDAGKLYLVLGSLSGSWPGLPLTGGTWPINLDSFALLMLGNASSILFPGTLGFLDAQGDAKAALDFGLLPSLPGNLIGKHIATSAWVFDGLGKTAGKPSNSVDVFFLK